MQNTGDATGDPKPGERNCRYTRSVPPPRRAASVVLEKLVGAAMAAINRGTETTRAVHPQQLVVLAAYMTPIKQTRKERGLEAPLFPATTFDFRTTFPELCTQYFVADKNTLRTLRMVLAIGTRWATAVATNVPPRIAKVFSAMLRLPDFMLLRAMHGARSATTQFPHNGVVLVCSAQLVWLFSGCSAEWTLDGSGNTVPGGLPTFAAMAADGARPPPPTNTVLGEDTITMLQSHSEWCEKMGIRMCEEKTARDAEQRRLEQEERQRARTALAEETAAARLATEATQLATKKLKQRERKAAKEKKAIELKLKRTLAKKENWQNASPAMKEIVAAQKAYKATETPSATDEDGRTERNKTLREYRWLLVRQQRLESAPAPGTKRKAGASEQAAGKRQKQNQHQDQPDAVAMTDHPTTGRTPVASQAVDLPFGATGGYGVWNETGKWGDFSQFSRSQLSPTPQQFRSIGEPLPSPGSGRGTPYGGEVYCSSSTRTSPTGGVVDFVDTLIKTPAGAVQEFLAVFGR